MRTGGGKDWFTCETEVNGNASQGGLKPGGGRPHWSSGALPAPFFPSSSKTGFLTILRLRTTRCGASPEGLRQFKLIAMEVHGLDEKISEQP